MLAMPRHMIVLWLLIIWQGGFVFYGLVVVNVGLQVLGAPLEQGWITQRVTNWLNLAGCLALAAWAWDIAAQPAPIRQRRQRWLVWLFLATMLIGLVVLHPLMDAHLNFDSLVFTDAPSFHEMHRWYLRVSTAQWLGAVLLSWMTMRAWQEASANPPSEP